MRVVRSPEYTLAFSLLDLCIIVMREAIKSLFVFVTRGDTSMSRRRDNASACTQGGEVGVADIEVRTNLQLHCGFLADNLLVKTSLQLRCGL